MINWDRVSELREEVGEEDLAEVILLFCEEVEEVLAVLDNATQADMPNHLHFLKGSALNIGFEAVSTRCQAEEANLKANPNTKPDISGIRADYASCKDELADLI